jgi:hypothetical protein
MHSDFLKKSLSFRGAKLWNSLSEELRTKDSFYSFNINFSLIHYNLTIKRAITLKQKAFNSVMSNLNFGICHVYFNIVFAEIFEFENK